MNVVIVDTINEGLTRLGVSRTSFHRMRKTGQACVDMVMVNGRPMMQIVVHGKGGHIQQERCATAMRVKDKPGTAPDISSNHPSDQKIESFFGHKKFVKGWIEWRDAGLGQRIWSKTYRTKMIRFSKRYFDQFNLISVEGLRAWLQECDPIQHSSRVDRHAFVSSMAKFLHYELSGQLSYEEYTRIQLLYPRKPPEYEPRQRIIYTEDFDSILEALPNTYQGRDYNALLLETLIILLSETGMRINELVTTPLEKYRFSDNPQRATVSVKGKGSKIRLIPFSKRAQEVLKHYLAERPAEADIGCLFSTYHYHKKEYTPLKDRWLQKEFEALSQKTEIPFSAHSFRHYRITQWANNPRIPITTTQKWAGHTSLMVTQRYIHTSDDQAMAAAFA